MAAEIPDGAVLVARGIINSSLWEMRPPDRIVALTCIALCNRRPKPWFDGKMEILIDRGQFVRSREEMVRACKLPLQVVRTSIDHLEEKEFLTRKLTRTYTLYTLPKYEHYQDLTKYSDSGVRKLTQVPTRSQPSKTQKINPEFQPYDGRNPTEPQSVADVLINCGNNLTRENKKTNHKQQQQTPPSSLLSRPVRSERKEEGVAVVVDPGTWADPVLAKPSFRISSQLLEEIKMAASVARSFAAAKPVGLVLRVVQQAKFQKKPGGWARVALENDWWLPEADGEELREVIGLVKADLERVNSVFLSRVPRGGQKLPERMPGEDDKTYLNRVNDELKRRRAQRSTGEQKARK